MDESETANADGESYRTGDVANDHVLTESGWQRLGTLSGEHVLTECGWVRQPRQQQPKSSAVPIVVPLATLAGGGLIALLGLALALQSASLLTGTGTNWTGAVLAVIGALVGGGAVGAAFMLGSPTWLKITSGIAAAAIAGIAILSVTNAVYLEVELEKKRQDFSDIFND